MHALEKVWTDLIKFKSDEWKPTDNAIVVPKKTAARMRQAITFELFVRAKGQSHPDRGRLSEFLVDQDRNALECAPGHD